MERREKPLIVYRYFVVRHGLRTSSTINVTISD